MIVWRFKRANTRTFSGKQHAFWFCVMDNPPWKSICGRTKLVDTEIEVAGYSSLPGERCKSCRRMVKTQQEFQQDPGGAR